MFEKNKAYRAIVSSDWNECLAPCGPFDFISFNYPQLAMQLETIFKQYTGNFISLGEAVGQIQKLLPAPVTEEQMDAYLDESFTTYSGVAELIEWCLRNEILIMINTTGMIGYFQRIFAKNLIPRIPVLSAHPMVRYPAKKTDPQQIFDLHETGDKGKNSEAVIRSFNIPPDKIIIMGDSGGDGPHFEWGAARGAFLIGNMVKPSLKTYCAQKRIAISNQFGISYAAGEVKDPQREMQVNFLDLIPVIESFLNY
jgi:2-hydroxy-3-keto-5-methylthiopentenyl-1-phosphate phosphatase